MAPAICTFRKAGINYGTESQPQASADVERLVLGASIG